MQFLFLQNGGKRIPKGNMYESQSWLLFQCTGNFLYYIFRHGHTLSSRCYMNSLYLVRYPEEPIRIQEKSVVTIGRADNNTIVLTESRVSRKHAQIEWRKQSKSFTISDVGSSNGTYINGARLLANQAHTLQDWDKIRIASIIFTARFVDNPAILKNEFKEFGNRVHFEATEVIHISELQNCSQETAFAGDLRHLCAVELFQMLENGSKTGKLAMKTDIGSGIFTIKEGMIIDAKFGDISGEQAVYETLRCTEGTFTFTPLSSINVQPQICMATTMLLIEGCRLLDEAKAVTTEPNSVDLFSLD